MGSTLLDYEVLVNMLFAPFARCHFGYEPSPSQKTKGVASIHTNTTPYDVRKRLFFDAAGIHSKYRISRAKAHDPS